MGSQQRQVIIEVCRQGSVSAYARVVWAYALSLRSKEILGNY